MPTINLSISVPKRIGDYGQQLKRLRTRKQAALIRAIQENQRVRRMGDDVQLRLGSRRVNIRKRTDTTRLVRIYAQRVFGQRWTALSTRRPPLDRVVNDIMQSVFVRSPLSLREKSRTARYRNSWQLYRRQSGKKNLQPATFPVSDSGWDNDTLFVLANLVSYASSLESYLFNKNSQGLMYQAARQAQKRWPFVGIRFRYYQENQIPTGDYQSANSDLRNMRYYAIPVIEIGRASLVRRPNRRPGVNSRSSREQLNRRNRQAARRNFARNRRR